MAFTNATAMTAYPVAFGWMSGPTGGGAPIQVQANSRSTLSGRLNTGTGVKSLIR